MMEDKFEESAPTLPKNRYVESEKTEDSDYQKAILGGLATKARAGHTFYMGTVPESVKLKRRAKNKRSKASRKKNR